MKKFYLLIIILGTSVILLLIQTNRISKYQNEINNLTEINNTLKAEVGQVKDKNKELELNNLELNKKIKELTIIDGASIEGLKYHGIDNYNKIIKDLSLHPELIPFDGILGGTMAFSRIYILNDKWVYASFDDGHIQGYGLYKFTIDEDLNISWELMDAILDSKDW